MLAFFVVTLSVVIAGLSGQYYWYHRREFDDGRSYPLYENGSTLMWAITAPICFWAGCTLLNVPVKSRDTWTVFFFCILTCRKLVDVFVPQAAIWVGGMNGPIGTIIERIWYNPYRNRDGDTSGFATSITRGLNFLLWLCVGSIFRVFPTVCTSIVGYVAHGYPTLLQSFSSKPVGFAGWIILFTIEVIGIILLLARLLVEASRKEGEAPKSSLGFIPLRSFWAAGEIIFWGRKCYDYVFLAFSMQDILQDIQISLCLNIAFFAIWALYDRLFN